MPHQSLPVTLGGSSQEKTTGQIQDMLMGFKIESDSYPVRPNGHGGDQRLLGCFDFCNHGRDVGTVETKAELSTSWLSDA